MHFFDRAGPVSIASRLRLLSETMQADSRAVGEELGLDLKPRWFPIFYLLTLDGPASVSDLAEAVGQHHPAVVRVVNELVKEGLVERRPDPRDGRKSIVVLTERGRRRSEHTARNVVPDVSRAVDSIAEECTHDLWAALAEWEAALRRKSLLRRTREARRARLREEVEIIEYAAEHQRAWHDINEEWISRYFEMEEADYKSLLDPETYILDRGGQIFLARFRGEIVGTVAMVPMDDPRFDFELAKMGVSPGAQGLGIGLLLGRQCLDWARTAGARVVYLETNARLGPALRLYEKLGFERVKGIVSPYARCDVQMSASL